MRKTVLLYGLALAALTAVLKILEYKFFIRDLSLEFYLTVVALFFTGLGIWAGIQLSRKKQVPIAARSGEAFTIDNLQVETLGLSKRELEVLQLMSQGLSNQEIADRLFVSLNTVKTHSSNLFIKLDVRRRTQAVQKGKDLRLIP